MSRVDVIVPCYRYGRFLRTCVDSVAHQRGVNVRILIIDDCSPDETSEVAADLAMQYPCVAWIRHETNQGHIATYNHGLDWVTGDYVLLLSADDALTPGSLERAVQVMDRNPVVTLAYGRDIVFDTQVPPPIDGCESAACAYELVKYPRFLRMSSLLGHTPIQAPTVLVRASTQKEIGYYESGLPHTADTEIWLRLASRGEVAVLDAIQAYRRLHDSNMSLSFTSPQRLREQMRAFNKHLESHPQMASTIRPLLGRAAAERALWGASIALENGSAALCSEFLQFAVETRPSVRWSLLWSKVQLKRILWRSASLHRGAKGAAPLTAPRTKSSAAPVSIQPHNR